MKVVEASNGARLALKDVPLEELEWVRDWCRREWVIAVGATRRVIEATTPGDAKAMLESELERIVQEGPGAMFQGDEYRAGYADVEEEILRREKSCKRGH